MSHKEVFDVGNCNGYNHDVSGNVFPLSIPFRMLIMQRPVALPDSRALAGFRIIHAYIG